MEALPAQRRLLRVPAEGIVRHDQKYDVDALVFPLVVGHVKVERGDAQH